MDWISLLILGEKLNLSNVQKLADIAQSLATIIAIALGALWAYFNFIMGRVYSPRLEPEVSGEVTFRDDMSYLLVIGRMKNVGLSKFEHTPNTTLDVFWYEVEEGITMPESIWWETFPEDPAWSLFDGHEWIEPSETIEDQRLIVIPGRHYFAFKVKLVIRSRKRIRLSSTPPFFHRRASAWETTKVVFLTQESQDNNNDAKGQSDGGAVNDRSAQEQG